MGMGVMGFLGGYEVLIFLLDPASACYSLDSVADFYGLLDIVGKEKGVNNCAGYAFRVSLCFLHLVFPGNNLALNS